MRIIVPKSLGPRDWGEELQITDSPLYLGKILQMRAGARGGLQYHEAKDETFFLVTGEAWVELDPTRSRALTRYRMSAGMAFHIHPRDVHRVTAISDCTFFEVSTPHFDDRVRVEAQYDEPIDGGLPTTGNILGPDSRANALQYGVSCAHVAEPDAADPWAV